MSRHLYTFAMLFFVGLQLAHADVASVLFEKGRSEYFIAKKTTAVSAKQKQLYKAASTLREFVDLYPYNPKTPDALYDLGSLYQELSTLNGDRDTATRSTYFLKELVQKFPRNALADDALLKQAQICRTVFQDEKCAQDALTKIRTEYRNSDILSQMDGNYTTGPAELQNVEIEETPAELVFRFQLSARKNITGKTVAADPSHNLPERYFFDLDNVQIRDDFSLSKTFSQDSPVLQIRYGKNQNSLRVVLDLAKTTSSDKIVLYSIEKGFTVKVPKPGTSPQNVVAVVEPPPSPASVVPAPMLDEFRKPPGQRRIILDAGHGGEDGGAVGKKGTLEKIICLSVVKKVEEILRKRSDYEIFLTRKEDVFIPLARRTSLANEWRGDLFVSIHANASPRRGAEGVSTYFLDNHDDTEALRVAERENAEPGVVIAQPQNGSENQYLEIMKASMVKNFHTVQSTDFAQFVQTNLLKELRQDFSGVTDLGVKSARFFVLTGARMPAILIETSFISNPQEERRLTDSRYQKSIAQAVVRGIDQFFKSSVGRGDHAALYQK